MLDELLRRKAPRYPAAAANVRERHLSYQPALDGLRGLAVAAVLAYHADLPFARGGFLGVDAFFVLSGYLITSLLLAEWRTNGTINLAAFWARRARRLFPALFLVLVGIAGYAVVFADPAQLDKLRSDSLATLGYFANWQLAFSGESYFDQFSLPSPLRHTWSLAIEEQWYVVWPLLLVALLWWRRGSLRVLLVAAVVMMAGSALLMAWLHDPQADPSRVYYGTDTRAQSLLVGAVFAMLLARHGPIRAGAARLLLQLAAAACVVYVGWLWVATPDNSALLYRGGFLLSAVAVAVVITAVVQPQPGALGRLLSVGPLRGLGLISYGVYLWHWPIYLVLTPDRTGLDGTSLLVAKVALTLAIAGGSYYLVEMPVRRGALRTWRASWAMAPAVASVLVVGLVMATRGGTPALALPADAGPASLSVSTADVLAAAYGPQAAAAPMRVLLVGDSVAHMMAPGLSSRQEEQNFVLWNGTILACGIVGGDVKTRHGVKAPSPECEDRMERWRAEVQQFQPQVVVLLSGLWDGMDHKVDGRMLEFGTPEADAYWLSEMQAAIDLLSSRGAEVAILSALYFPEEGLAPERVDQLNTLYREAAWRNPDSVTFVDLNGFLYPTGELIPYIDGVNVRGDGYHFSQEGADMVGRWLAPKIGSIARDEGSTAAADIAAADPASSPFDAAGDRVIMGVAASLTYD